MKFNKHNEKRAFDSYICNKQMFYKILIQQIVSNF